MKGIARFCLLLAGLSLIVNGCTTRPVVVPTVDYAEASHDGDAQHRLRTTEGKSYIVNRFVVTDSTLTIIELKGTGEQAFHEPRAYPGVELPLKLPLDQIESIERLGERTTTGKIMSASVSTVAIVVIVTMVLLGWALSDINFD